MANYRDRRVGQEIMREVNDILNKRIRDHASKASLLQMFV